MERDYLPISRADMERRGWDQCDFVYVIGDAYVDHPTFGHAIISRVLEDAGYRVGIISQPDWKDPGSIRILGEPRLAFLVMGGNMDSMVNHYSVSKKRRKFDDFTPGGAIGKRPDHAATVYCNLIRRSYPKKPVIVGGIEASLRRLGHYDYWSDGMKRSLLLDAQADLLLYGMGEKSIVEVAEALDSGLAVSDITFVRGSVYKAADLDSVYDYELLPSYEKLCEDRRNYAKSFYTQYCNTDPYVAKRLVEPYEKDRCFVVQNPPQEPLTTAEMDHIYALPYMRNYHPSYEALGGVAAIEEVKF
ncbi:MAG: YgiQ family radical SAM protein, partial [Oscillospiraceae bacterium]|nr:YgiQ family radical SAM protein [Oscillospiraceae bacterium]